MTRRRKLLYCSSLSSVSFANSIADMIKTYRHTYAITGNNPFLSLPEADGIILVGSQTAKMNDAVFGSHHEYFEFLDEAHDSGKKVAAVLDQYTNLPHENERVDYVIVSHRGVIPIRSITGELTHYFNQNIK